MISGEYVGYQEGRDLTRIPSNFLAYPSQNVIIYKGVAYSRAGIVNDGNEPTGEHKIIGEFVWKDALGGERALRATKNGKVQVKYNGLWITIFSSLDGDAVRVRFATWIDSTGNIIKKRLFFVDGSNNIYEWNGAIAVVQSADAGAQTVAIEGTKTLEQLGFDPGDGTLTGTVNSSGTAVTGTGTKFTLELVVGDTIVADGESRTVTAIADDTNLTVNSAFGSPLSGDTVTLRRSVQIVRFSSGTVAGIEAYLTDSNMESGTLHVLSSFSVTPVADDIIVGAVVKHTTILNGILKDDVYEYKNHLAVATLESIRVYFSSVETKLDFTVPAPNDRDALSPFTVDMAGNYTAMIRRFNPSTQEAILWMSDVDGWTKVNALIEEDAFGNWVGTQRVAETERIGALPFAVADYKGDPIYLAQDRTLNRIVTIDVIGKDALQDISDEVDGLLRRLDASECRVYYYSRYIYITFPAESVTVMLDMNEGHFMPPQTLPMGYMSVIDGVQYGHSNSRDETFKLFSGYNDLGTPYESVFAFPYYQGAVAQGGGVVSRDFRRKTHQTFGVSARMTKATVANVVELFENDGYAGTETFKIDGATVKMYEVPQDDSWAARVWGGASWGGDEGAVPLGRVYAFRKYDDLPWFEFRPIITVTAREGSVDHQFALLGWYIDDGESVSELPDDLFISR